MKMTIKPAMSDIVLTAPLVLKPRKRRKEANIVAVEKQT